MKKNRALLFWLAVLFVFGGTMTILYATGLLNREREVARAGSSTTVANTETMAATTGEIGEFQMTDQLGRKFHSDELKGQIWVGSVFYSSCPTTCRMQNAEVAKLQHEYADKGVRLVSITCDPDRDTVDRLAEYARMFNADPEKWHFLTGDFEEAERIGNEMFGIVVQRETHSDRLILVNRDGKVHGTYRSTQIDDVTKLRKDLDKLLAAEANPTITDQSPETGEVAVSTPEN